MKKLLIAVIILAFTIAGAYAVNVATKKHVPSDYKIGVSYDEAMQSEKPVIALFYVDWCGYCLRFMPKFKTVSNLYKDKYDIVMINAEDPEHQDLVQDVALSGFPTMYIIDPKYDNRFLLNNSIYMDLKKLRVELDRYLKIRAQLDEAKACHK